MSQSTNSIPVGAATARDLGAWFRMSRNTVPGTLASCGVTSPGNKFPWHRIVYGVLGLQASGAEVVALKQHRMVTLTEAAEELGLTPEGFKDRLENRKIVAPPMYVFGARSRRFIGAQFQDFIRSKHWNSCVAVSGHATGLAGIAAELAVPVSRLEELLDSEQVPDPMHIITEGRKDYIRHNALNAFRPHCPAVPTDVPAVAPSTCAERDPSGTMPAGGLFAAVGSAMMSDPQ